MGRTDLPESSDRDEPAHGSSDCSFGLVTGALFYLAITPFGVASRPVGKDPLRRGFDRTTSCWIDHTPSGTSPQSMSNQF
jgi:hypothetical protein